MSFSTEEALRYLGSEPSAAFSHCLMVLRVSVVRLAISLIDICSQKNIRRILAYMTMVITSFTPAYKISRILVLPSQNSTYISALIWLVLTASTLIHTRKPSLEVELSSLSSGERVLMALVNSVYKPSSDNIFPNVLLLDALDASLHPSMMKSMLL